MKFTLNMNARTELPGRKKLMADSTSKERAKDPQAAKQRPRLLNSLDEHRNPDSAGDEESDESGAGVNTGSSPAADGGLIREPRVEERLAKQGEKRGE
jgi:hypothetical protein